MMSANCERSVDTLSRRVYARDIEPGNLAEPFGNLDSSDIIQKRMVGTGFDENPVSFLESVYAAPPSAMREMSPL